MGSPRYSIETHDMIDEITNDEELLARIDRVSTPGTKIVCIKKFGLNSPKTYSNFREWLEKRKIEEYTFNEGQIYEVDKIANDFIQVNRYSFRLLDIENETYRRYPYFFEHFISHAEWTALQRDEKIDEIIN